MDAEIEEAMGCTCLHIRRATRRITQIYDRALEPAGLTINQFGLLMHLHAARRMGRDGFSIGALAERLGADPTTLNRTLKPLLAKDWVRDCVDPADGRVRLVSITDAGQREILGAMPHWRQAQAHVMEALGAAEAPALNGLLDLAVARLGPAD